MACQCTVTFWPLICTLCCFRSTIFQIYSLCHSSCFFYHKWCQSSEQVSPKKCVCQTSSAVTCTHSHQHLWIVRRMFPADRSQRFCYASNTCRVFFILTPLLSIDPCNKPNNAVFPFMYFISDLFMSEYSIVWIVCVKSSPVASGI